jgi:hypothetical protein
MGEGIFMYNHRYRVTTFVMVWIIFIIAGIIGSFQKKFGGKFL